VVTNAGVSCSVHTWNDNLRDSFPHLNAVVTPETCSVRGHIVFFCHPRNEARVSARVCSFL